MTEPPGPLAGRRALVTGAASGIGAACASALAAAGAYVIAADVDPAGAERIAAELGGEPWSVDLTDTAALGLRASPYKSAYVAVKHGLEGLSKVIALEGAEYGVTSNCISPGYVRTPLVQKQIADQARLHGIGEDEVIATVLLAETAVKRLVEAAEVAELAAWLAGPSAGMATGASFTIDGGWSAK